jgi:hypothetical protein
MSGEKKVELFTGGMIYKKSSLLRLLFFGVSQKIIYRSCLNPMRIRKKKYPIDVAA